MATKKILQLPALAGLTGAEWVPVVSGSTTSRAQATQFNITGSNVASAQSANLIFAGPSSGAPAFPTFRLMVSNDLPTPVVQLGGVDIAAPVAQTLSVQNVLTGTSNTAGADWTFIASRGTGTGRSGNINFQVSPLGASGTTQNTPFTLLRLSAADPNTNTAAVSFFSNTGTPFVWDTSTFLGSTGSPGNTLAMTVGGQGVFYFDGNGPVVTGTKYLGFSAGVSVAPTTLLTAPATATLQLGNVDAAAPVAQTLKVQSVVAGTSNTAGVNWTLKASAGTGTGAGGNFIFQGAPAGGSGTTQNAFATAFSITAAGQISAASNILTAGNLYFGGGSISLISSAVDGTIILSNAGATRQDFLTVPVSATWQLGQADAAAPVAQTLGVQNVVAGTSNTAGANWLIKGSAGTGTGSGGQIIFQIAPPGSSGTTQNAYANILQVASTAALSGIVIDGNTAIPAGGTTGTGISLSSSSFFGMYFGSGAPTLSAAQGSIYLRSDGYPSVNTNGSTTWYDISAGFGVVTVSVTGINFNSANTDTSIAIPLPLGLTRYRFIGAYITHASATITTATCGIFSASGGGGTAVVTSGTAITVNTASENTNNNMQTLSTANASTQSFNFTPLFFRVQTAQGSAATANVTIQVEPCP